MVCRGGVEMTERDLYSVYLPEVECEPVAYKRFCCMPDGQMIDRTRNYGDYAVYYYEKNSDKTWHCYENSFSMDTLIETYNKLVSGKLATMYPADYFVITETKQSGAKGIKTKKEYISKNISLHNDFGSGFFGWGTAKSYVHEDWDEITKELADYMVETSVVTIHKKDCILISDEVPYNGRYTALTRFYGKYYCIGWITEEEGEDFRTPGYVEPAKETKVTTFKKPQTSGTRKLGSNSTRILNSSLQDMQDKIVKANKKIKELEKEQEEFDEEIGRYDEELRLLENADTKLKEKEKQSILINEVVTNLNISNSELKENLKYVQNVNKELNGFIKDNINAQYLQDLEKEVSELRKQINTEQQYAQQREGKVAELQNKLRLIGNIATGKV